MKRPHLLIAILAIVAMTGSAFAQGKGGPKKTQSGVSHPNSTSLLLNGTSGAYVILKPGTGSSQATITVPNTVSAANVILSEGSGAQTINTGLNVNGDFATTNSHTITSAGKLTVSSGGADITGTTSITGGTTIDVTGHNLTLTGVSAASGAPAGGILALDGSGNVVYTTASNAGVVTGTGTANNLTRWSNTTGGLVDAHLTDNNSDVKIGAYFDVTLSSGTLTTAGNVVTTGTGTITSAAGLTVTAGGATITDGGLTVTAGGATIHGTTSINTTADDGNVTIGNNGNVTINGTTGIHGTTSINTTASDGDVTIGNNGNVTVVGLTNINAGTSTYATNIGTGTSAGATSIGNSGHAITLTGSTVGVSGVTTVTGATTIDVHNGTDKLTLTGIPENTTPAAIVVMDADGVVGKTSASSAGIVTGSGTVNTLPKWTNTSGALGDSKITDDGTDFQVNGSKFSVVEATGALSTQSTLTVTPTTDVASVVVNQTTAGTPTADIFKIQNGSTSFFKVNSDGIVVFSSSVPASATAVTLDGKSFFNTIQANAGGVALTLPASGVPGQMIVVYNEDTAPTTNVVINSGATAMFVWAGSSGNEGWQRITP